MWASNMPESWIIKELVDFISGSILDNSWFDIFENDIPFFVISLTNLLKASFSESLLTIIFSVCS